MLAINDLSVKLGSVPVLSAVGFTCERGKVTAVIGPNGAGKTTLFDTLTGFIDPISGSVECEGRSVDRLPPHQVARAGISRTFQTPRLFDQMTVLENLKVAHPDGGLLGLMVSAVVRREENRQDRIAHDKAMQLLEFLHLERVRNNVTSDLSGGQRKLVELGRALMTDPEYILLDEPVAGVAPALVAEVGVRLRELAAQGLGVVVIEHNMDFVMKVSDYVIVMVNGMILTKGTAAEIRADPRVLEAYLGGAAA